MDRRDVLKRLLYPKCKTAIEFQFDTLIANPLLTYITVQDIAQLHKIATSIKYSSRPKEKYAMIDNILVPRGFKKMASGTNRVVYRFLDDYRIVLKVAIDKVGLSDNGNEYRIQHLLKPFVTKCFEISPCGTVGIFERVIPITSREEFVNISSDVFDLINNLVGKYVLEDIGEKFYMNYGLREGFGPVLLDYPYVFELDGRKLICNVPDPMEPKGYCGGEIDYDLGYNNLICTKCGKRYLATELKSEEKSDKPKIIIKGEDSIMKCVLKRGNEVVSKLNSEAPVSTNTIRPRKEYDRLKVTLSRKEEEKKDDYKPNIRIRDDIRLQARVKGREDKSKRVDEIAIKKQNIIDRNTETIPVSLGLFEDIQNIHTMKEESKFEARLSSDEDKSKHEHITDNTDNSIKVIITDKGEIIKSDNNELVGYTVDFVFSDVMNSIKMDIKNSEAESEYKDEQIGTVENEDKSESDTDEDSGVVYSDDDTASGFKLGEIIADKIKSTVNNNYKTNNITSPIENHYSSVNIKKENKSNILENY